MERINNEIINVSYQSKVKFSQGLNTTPINNIFNTIKDSPEIADLIVQLRAISDEKEQKLFKERNFPYFNLGTFRNDHRKNSNLISTQFLLFDYDCLDDRSEEIKQKLTQDKTVYAYFISPRGNGLKVIYALDKPVTDYKLFSKVYKYYAKQFKIDLGAEPDKTSDASRPCYFSYDPDLYINPEVEPLLADVINITGQNNTTLNLKKLASEELKYLPSAIEFLKSKIDNYSNWINCGFALASLEEDGREYFHQLSDNPKYKDSPEEIDAKFDNLLAEKEGSVSIATLFQIAKDYGYTYPEIKDINEVVPFDVELEEQFKLDDTRDPNKLLGFPLTKFQEFAKNIDGLQPGFYLLGAESNIGKTAVLTNLCLDVLDTNPDVTAIYFSLDDSRKYTAYRFLSIMTQFHINETRKKQTDPIKLKELNDGRGSLIALVRSGRLVVKDIAKVSHIEDLKEEILKVKALDKLVVFVDGLYNLDVGERFRSIREENIERARQIKYLVDTYRIPILTTGELRKKMKDEKKDKAPTVHDLMETGKFAYNANVVLMLYGKEEDLKSDIPILTLEYVKNKLSDYKGISFLKFKRTTGTMSEILSLVPLQIPKGPMFDDGGGLE